MGQLFNSVKPVGRRVYRVENINASLGISSSLRVSEDRKNYAVCLCLPNKTVKTVFHDEQAAVKEMKRLRELYKTLPAKKKKY